MKAVAVILLLLMSIQGMYGQISFRNQFKYTHWEDYDSDKLDGPNLLLNWADLTYQHNWFSIGLRYEINRPPDPYIFENDTLLKQYDLTFRYAEFYYKDLTATVGTFYTIFGRGLTLRTYEERNLRVDNNIDGIRINYDGSFIRAQALAGKMRDKYNRREDVLYGIDAEIKPFKNLRIGGNFLREDEPGNQFSQIWSGRLQYSYQWLGFYGELVRPDWYDAYSYYAALNATIGQFAITGEYKNYDHLSFRNSFGQEYNAPPSLSREHTFTYLNRHPHALNLDDEKGYQIEVNWFPNEEWEIILNHSRTDMHSGVTSFKEYYADVHNYFNQNLEWRLAGAWTFDLTTNTDNITPIAEVYMNVNELDQIHISFQHQHTKNLSDLSEYDNNMLILEFTRSPWLNVAVVGEETNQYLLTNVNMDKHTWLYATATFTFWNNQQVTLLYGSRREGFVCVGGICRYEPEFQGLELKFTLRL